MATAWLSYTPSGSQLSSRSIRRAAGLPTSNSGTGRGYSVISENDTSKELLKCSRLEFVVPWVDGPHAVQSAARFPMRGSNVRLAVRPRHLNRNRDGLD